MARSLVICLLLCVSVVTWMPLCRGEDQPAGPAAPAVAAAAPAVAAAAPAGLARDRQLQRLAVQRAQSGDWVGALQTLAGVRDPRQLSGALQDVQSALQQRPSGQSDSRYQAASGAAGGAPGEGGSVAGGGPAGGSFADFTPLMDLIQSTIAPDTWEAAGGSSTIRPYVAGIVVDPTGLVSDLESAQPGEDMLANIAVLLADEQVGPGGTAGDAVQAWRLPAHHRCVSLRGVARQVLRHRLNGKEIGDDLRHLAGLSRVNYVVLVPERRDVVLIGAVGGIQSHQGWLRDRRSALPAIRLDFLTACATAVVAGEPLGCSIDPSPESLAAAAQVGAAIRGGEVPLGKAEDALRQALGEQAIRVFGIAGDTPLAYLMVQADRHMKRLSLGLEPMPRGVPNYLDLVDQHIERGPPDGQLLRLWFTASPLDVRVCSESRVYQLAKRPMKLASQTELAGLEGDRQAAPDDIRLVDFVEEFNKHLDEIIRDYPAYGALQSVYQAAAVMEVLRRSDAQPWIADLLAPLLLHDASGGVMAVPKRVETIAAGHWVKHRGKRHFVLLASGGVKVDPGEAVKASFQTYPAIDAMKAFATLPVEQPERWWWDAL